MNAPTLGLDAVERGGPAKSRHPAEPVAPDLEQRLADAVRTAGDYTFVTLDSQAPPERNSAV